MNRSELEGLYKNMILPESKNPYHFEGKETASDHVKAYNPMCGDKFHLHLDIQGDALNEVHYSGIGCAISKASTSLLLQSVEGQNIDEARKIIRNFLEALESGSIEGYKERIKLRTLLELRNFDGRVDCIQLSWKALEDYLSNK